MKSEIDVPDGWRLIPLGEILDVITGKKNVQDSDENGFSIICFSSSISG